MIAICRFHGLPTLWAIDGTDEARCLKCIAEALRAAHKVAELDRLTRPTSPSNAAQMIHERFHGAHYAPQCVYCRLGRVVS